MTRYTIGITERHRTLTASICISQLFANDGCIRVVPWIVAHCPPGIVDAHLNPTFIQSGTPNQSNVTICTGCRWHIKRKLHS